jgi:hypothetical protein
VTDKSETNTAVPTKKDYLADIAQSLESIEMILHDIRNAVEKDS